MEGQCRSGELGLSPLGASVPGCSCSSRLLPQSRELHSAVAGQSWLCEHLGFSEWGALRISLKCLNFWHLVLEVSFAFKYDCRTQSCVCAGQTAVPIINIFVLSFLSFKWFYGYSLSPFEYKCPWLWHFLFWLWSYLFCQGGRSVWCNYTKSYWEKEAELQIYNQQLSAQLN